jgi:hypothetical protein
MDETFEGPYNYDSYTIELDESEAPIYKRSSAVKPFRGSAFGLGKAQMQSIQNEWRIGLLDNKSDALQFLKEYAYLD